ncbi:MAG TPA: lysylphosphatidylglycerol synthase domain-containing protein, partial [Nitrospiria bacterium]|nr:lysylphosphatidylglycerol synthase domain-containing protein [Nitrospiria bacterium]
MRWWRYIAGATVIGLAAYYFSVQMEGRWFDLVSWSYRVGPMTFLFSVQLLVFYHFVLAWLFKSWVKLFGEDLPWVKSFKVLYISQMARFLPGGVWGYVGQVYLGGQEGIHRGKLVLASVGHMALNVMSGVIIAAALVPVGTPWSPTWRSLSVVLVGMGLAIALYSPAIRWLGRRLGGNQGSQKSWSRIETASFLKLFLMYGAHWLLYGGAFWFFLDSLQVSDRLTFGEATGSLALAGVAGLITPFVPGGLGVREGVLAFLLKPSLGASGAAAVSLLSRV